MSRSPMIARNLPALHRALDRLRLRKATVALVPTMGALHDGHVSLVRLAKRRASKVVVSIFVNPAQFAPTEDFGSYPRTWKSDVAKLAAEDVDLIWNPDVKTMYPASFATRIVPEGPATAGLEDRFRPHFFGGVATVVGKLFTQVRPDFAIFGEKDFQQLRVVTRMATDLDLRVRVTGSRTVRERDGLAMSSRNVLPVTGGTAGGAGALPRHEGERAAVAGWRRGRRRDGCRRRDDICSGLRAGLFRGASRRNPGADQFGQGRADANSRRRQDRQDEADRQCRGIAPPISPARAIRDRAVPGAMARASPRCLRRPSRDPAGRRHDRNSASLGTRASAAAAHR